MTKNNELGRMWEENTDPKHLLGETEETIAINSSHDNCFG
jgi:hypothetical protein